MNRILIILSLVVGSLTVRSEDSKTYDPAVTAPPPVEPSEVKQVIKEKIEPESQQPEVKGSISEAKATSDPATTKNEISADAEKKPRKVKFDKSNGLKTTVIDCELLDQPNGKKIGFQKSGKAIWTDDHDQDWYKVYRKTGEAFLKKTCF